MLAGDNAEYHTATSFKDVPCFISWKQEQSEAPLVDLTKWPFNVILFRHAVHFYSQNESEEERNLPR